MITVLIDDLDKRVVADAETGIHNGGRQTVAASGG